MTPPLIVQKYGGTSLGTPERIRTIAARIADRARRGQRIVVIVSAMGKTTDELLELAYRITPSPSQRELDMLLTVGERISMALLSMALNHIGCNAISFTGSQSGIVTDVSHTRALIEEIRGDRILSELDHDRVVIVAGFQGVSRTREITTLGRGGSDTTAVALAARLDASCCEIYSDVAGIFTADPRIVPHASGIERIGHDELLELAALGARVLHYRAAEMARRYRVRLQLLSSFDSPGGTTVEDRGPMESTCATSVTYVPEVILIEASGTDTASMVALASHLAAGDVPVIGYHRRAEGGREIARFLIEVSDVDALDRAAAIDPSIRLTRHDALAMVSVVGSGFARSARAFAGVERVLANAAIPVTMTLTSSCAVSCVVPEDLCRTAVERLHHFFIESPGAPERD